MSKSSGSRSHSRGRSRSRSPVTAPGPGSGSAPTRERRLRSKRVILLNLPYNMNVLRLKNLIKDRLGFAGFANLLDENGRSSGIGCMDFKSYEGAEEAIKKLHGWEIDGRRVKAREETPGDRERFDRAEADNARYSQPPPPPPPASSSSHRRYPTSPSPPPSSSSRGGAQAVLNQLGIRGPICSTVFVSNLDARVTWQKLKDVFRLAGRVLKADIIGDRDAKRTGKVAGLVQFETPLEAAQAISMLNNQPLFERPMRIRMDMQQQQQGSGDSRDRGGRSGPPLPEGLGGLGSGLGAAAARTLQEMLGMSGDNGASGGRGGGGRGGPPPSAPSSTHPMDTVFVSNLPYSFGWPDLKRAFKQAGDVKFADIDLGADRRSLGSGVVRFASSAEAKRAVAVMDGTRLEGRTIRVALK